MKKLFDKLNESVEFNRILQNNDKVQEIGGLTVSAFAFFVSALSRATKKQALVIVPSSVEISELADSIEALLNDIKTEILIYPVAKLNSEVLPVSKEDINMRISVLNTLMNNKNTVILSHENILDEKIISQLNFKEQIISLETGEKFDLSLLQKKFAENGYERVPVVEGIGEWNTHGGIVDVFPFGSEMAVRCELDGDEIASLRFFDTVTQKSEKNIDNTIIPPALFNEGDTGIVDYFSKDTIVLGYEINDSDIASKLDGKLKFIKTSMLRQEKENVFIKSTDVFRMNLDLLQKEFNVWKQDNYSLFFFCNNEGEETRLIEILDDRGISSESEINFEIGYLSSGFVWPSIKLVVISNHELFGRYESRPARMKFKGGQPIRELIELKVNDYVVHSDYGIGKYMGTSRLNIQNGERDFLSIMYDSGDKLHVPLERISLVQKYIGGKGERPELNKLGTSNWQRTKERIKEKARKMAEELLKIYAVREVQKGYSFPSDTHWQNEFEESFLYEETIDQLKAAEEIKKDMEEQKPMDRLLCGDVGYGKTEVAMRACFKAAMDKKQVAVLAPTTILAEQHYFTFKERMADYPVNIAMLSRFKTANEQKKIVEDINKGLVDIIIGTHRLIQKDIVFKNLGLVIVDEEHRFGVVQKEKFKKMFASVDILALTATPIPRTLHIALSGIVKISLINTPPKGRLPVETYCMTFNENVIKQAILREISRDGQIFYLHNRIDDIDKTSLFLSNLIPEAKIAVAHGRMSSHSLENVIKDFIRRKYNVLLSTSIIESGLDMPNVNTLIIENAHMFGLADLYQLRGRIGRSNRKAFAFLTYPKEEPLSLTAKQRLKAIEECNNLGSGFRIALKDMEIRGAGNILGKEQHGNIEAVGFDLYCQLLAEAVSELKKEPPKEEIIPEISLMTDAYLPYEYVPDETAKLQLYKAMASIKTYEELKNLKDEMEDRFGRMPEVADALFKLMEIKLLAVSLRIKSIKETENEIKIISFGKFSDVLLFKNELKYESLKVVRDTLYDLKMI